MVIVIMWFTNFLYDSINLVNISYSPTGVTEIKNIEATCTKILIFGYSNHSLEPLVSLLTDF